MSDFAPPAMDPYGSDDDLAAALRTAGLDDVEIGRIIADRHHPHVLSRVAGILGT